MDNIKGRLIVDDRSQEKLDDNQVRRGHLRVRSSGTNAGHIFEYADVEPFLWIGDTWWNWTNRRIKIETFRQMVDDRAEKGFKMGQLFVPGNGWGRESSLLSETYDALDTHHGRKAEGMIAYATSNGITV